MMTLAASSDSRRRHGATLHDDAGREKSVGDGWHVTASISPTLTNRIERTATLGEMKKENKRKSEFIEMRSPVCFWLGAISSRDSRSITWYHEPCCFFFFCFPWLFHSRNTITSFVFPPYAISIDFSPSLATFSDCLGRTGRENAQCDVRSF